MKTVSPKRVPFVCPACAAPNEVALVQLARAGSMLCVACKRRLSSSDVARALHAPRTERSKAPPGHIVSGQRRLGGTRPK